MLVLTTLILALCCLTFDLLTPLSTGEWGLYLVPLLLTSRVRQPRYPLWFAGLCTALTAFGFWFAPHGVSVKWGLLSRAFGIIVFWLTAFLVMQRRQSERALHDQQYRLQAILDHAPLAIFVKDLAGRYVEFSRQCEINTGLTRAQVIGKTDRELFTDKIADGF